MRILAAIALILFYLPAGAQVTTVANVNPKDEIARLQTEHLKEIVTLIEKKNAELRAADISANEQRFKAQEQAVAFALASAEKAVTKAELAAEKRFESVNEFRNQLKDQTGTFITRNEMWGWLVAIIMMGFSAWNILRTIVHPLGSVKK